MRADRGTGTHREELGRFQHLLVDMFAKVIRTPSDGIEAAVAEALPRVRENLNVDAVRLLRFDADGRTLTVIQPSAHASVLPNGDLVRARLHINSSARSAAPMSRMQ